MGQAVMVRNAPPGPDWIPGITVERLWAAAVEMATDQIKAQSMAKSPTILIH